MATFISNSPEETLAFGEELGRQLMHGRVLALQGDLGAGKTQLVKGIARGIGSTERVQSPTFGLIHSHLSGRIPLHHLDLYRLDSPQAILAAGLESYLFPRDGASVIEWPERWCSPDSPPSSRRGWQWITLETLSETERRIVYEDPGS